ncbi:MAG: primosomal protein N' [Chitinophagaceae bacterium]|nr:MAG: primosomal protein N' [Chitinophagaceae bacterium]
MSEQVLFTEGEVRSSGQSWFADVIIPLALPRNYTWSIPEALREQVRPGVRVEVNLGKNKKYAGIVRRVHQEEPAAFAPKEILNVLDVEPVVFEEQLSLWHWIASYYMCTEGEVMAAAVPAHFKLSSETILVFNEEYGEDFSELDHDEFIVAEALLLKKELKLTEVQQLLDSHNVYPMVNKMINRKVCFVWESLVHTYAPKKETYIQLETRYEDEDQLADLLNNWSRAPKQMELLLAYLHISRTEGEVTKAALLKKSGASDAQLKGLVEKKVLRTEKRQVDRIRYLPRDINIDFELSPAQELALQQVVATQETTSVCLLHGVTSSGKTQIYIRQIEAALRHGKQVLYMLPEIALTGQIIRRLQKHFGGYIGVYHSKFSQNERVEIWHKVKNGEIRVILGARSTVFLPFQDLGLIICDEEHDSSYKQQDPAPRYNGRDAAIYLASIFKAKVLLGSATPSLETYHNAVTGKYGHVELNERYGNVGLPPINIIDKKTIQQGNSEKSIVLPPLVTAVNEVLAREKQVILFQNRRGYTPYQVCTTCGWIPQCKHCDVSLTFHKFSNKLVCHYCGTSYAPLQTCTACGSHTFAQKNFGTEKIEEILQEVFPQAKVGRMDMDTVRGKNAHDVLIQQFEQHRIDILVGTQMVVKGLDFDNVDLVGILDADGLLHFADFRVNERAFQLMEQVSGRAGRREDTGQVLIQASQPFHPVLQYVKGHDYKKMYEEEITKRKQFFYPPYSRMIALSFRHKVKDVVQMAAIRFAETLQQKYGDYIVGPAEPVVGRVRNRYLMELLLKLPKDPKLIAACKRELLHTAGLLVNDPLFRTVVIVPDVDPV